MALTVDPQSHADDVWGRHPVRFLKITPDDSWLEAGEAFEPKDYSPGYGDPLLLQLTVRNAGYVAGFDATNRKIRLFWVDTTTDGAALAPVVDETDLSTTVVIDAVLVF